MEDADGDQVYPIVGGETTAMGDKKAGGSSKNGRLAKQEFGVKKFGGEATSSYGREGRKCMQIEMLNVEIIQYSRSLMAK